MSDNEQGKQPERTEEQTEKTAGERVVELNDRVIGHEKTAAEKMSLENPDSTPPPPPKEDTSDKK